MIKRLAAIGLTTSMLAGGLGLQTAAAEDTTATPSVAVAAPAYYGPFPYAYGLPYALGPWADPFGLAQHEWALAQGEVMRDLMDREAERHFALMDNQRRWADNRSAWHRAQFDAWERWVDPWGAARRDWADARHDAVKAQHDRYRGFVRTDGERPYRRLVAVAPSAEKKQ